MGLYYLNKTFIFKIIIKIFILFLSFKFSISYKIQASFVFGDSLLDVGNNNYITSLAQANHYPYGIDFGKATGRFCNGRTVVDVIGKVFFISFRCFHFCYIFLSDSITVRLTNFKYK
jgi:hypothetical protein